MVKQWLLLFRVTHNSQITTLIRTKIKRRLRHRFLVLGGIFFNFYFKLNSQDFVFENLVLGGIEYSLTPSKIWDALDSKLNVTDI